MAKKIRRPKATPPTASRSDDTVIATTTTTAPVVVGSTSTQTGAATEKPAPKRSRGRLRTTQTW